MKPEGSVSTAGIMVSGASDAPVTPYVVLDQNILEVEPRMISKSTVKYTVSDGRIVYEG